MRHVFFCLMLVFGFGFFNNVANAIANDPCEKKMKTQLSDYPAGTETREAVTISMISDESAHTKINDCGKYSIQMYGCREFKNQVEKENTKVIQYVGKKGYLFYFVDWKETSGYRRTGYSIYAVKQSGCTISGMVDIYYSSTVY